MIVRLAVPLALALALATLSTGCSAPPPATAASEASPGTVAYDRDVFQTLLRNHTAIRREVRVIDGGIESLTESDDPVIAALIKDHVAAMKVRVEHGRAIRVWDPMFREIFANADRIRLEYENTPGGVKVREVSDDPYVARLIQAHAEVVSGFVARGGAESQRAHEPPPR